MQVGPYNSVLLHNAMPSVPKRDVGVNASLACLRHATTKQAGAIAGAADISLIYDYSVRPVAAAIYTGQQKV